MFNYVGSPITLDFEVRNTNDVLVNADSVQFWWRVGLDGQINKGDVPQNTSTGIYEVMFRPDRGGTVYWRFTADTPDVVTNGRTYVEQPEFDEIWSTSQWV